jgi:hypothetical protein
VSERVMQAKALPPRFYAQVTRVLSPGANILSRGTWHMVDQLL